MSGNTIVNYAVAIVVGVVVAVATAGTGLAAYSSLLGTIAFSATAGVMSYYNRPGMPGIGGRGMKGGNNGSAKDAAAGQLEMTSASESVTAPVVFGTVRIATNLVRYDRSTFTNKPIKQKYKIEQPVVNSTPQSGGKGGGGGSPNKAAETKVTYQEQIVGYRYYLSFDLAICLGPIDAIGAIYSSPGELQVGTGGAFSGNTQSVTLSGPDEGGTVRLYKGSATQTRIAGDDYSDNSGNNHRNFAFAHFNKFFIGTTPAPKTYLFTVRRLPTCLDAAGSVITGLYTRGSTNPAHPCYQDANPAAILYEAFTNKLWGRGMSPELIDIESFKTASAYFAANNIGLSFTQDTSAGISDIVDQVRSHCATIISWNGVTLRCRCLLDRATEYARQVTISDDMAREVAFARPAWPDMPNDARITFTNRANNFQTEIAHVQDMAAINTVGFVNTKTLQLLGFSNRSTAEAQAKRILGEMSYPRATLTCKLNNWQSQLEPGDLIRFVWNHWTDGTASVWFRVLEIDDSQQAADGIKITCLEDLLLSPREDDQTPAPAIPVNESEDPRTDSDLALGDDHSAALTIGSPQPVKVWEQPPFLSSGDPDFIITARRPASFVTALLHRWTLTASPDFQVHSATSGWAIPGTLITPPPNLKTICRDTGDAFTFALADTSDNAALLAAANKVQLDTDNLATLSEAGTDLLLVGNEIIMLGNVTETSPGVFTATNYLRGAFGSKLEAHSTGDNFAFIEQWSRADFAATLGPIPTGQPITFRTVAVTTRGEDATTYDFTGPESDGSFAGRSAAPYPPELRDASRVGSVWTLSLRPRLSDRGAWTEGDIATDINALVTTLPDSYTLTVEPLNNSNVATGSIATLSPTWTPSDGISPTTGLLAATYTAPGGTTKLRIRATLNGKPSVDATTVIA